MTSNIYFEFQYESPIKEVDGNTVACAVADLLGHRGSVIYIPRQRSYGVTESNDYISKSRPDFGVYLAIISQGNGNNLHLIKILRPILPEIQMTKETLENTIARILAPSLREKFIGAIKDIDDSSI